MRQDFFSKTVSLPNVGLF